jgi:hypothetical protein
VEVLVRGKTYRIDTHRSGYGGPQYAAANVKLGSQPPLSKEHQEKYDAMTEDGWLLEATWDAYSQYARDDTVESWWEDAKERALKWKLGKVYSAGRSSGWLILDDYTSESLGILEENGRGSKCDHCNTYFDEHVKGKCLFVMHTYESHSPPDANVQFTLLCIIRFLRNCERSVRLWAGAALVMNMEFQIDQLWEEYQGSKNESHGV